MARARLKRLFVAHHGFAGVGVRGAGEAFPRRLLPLDDRQRQAVFHDAPVDFEHPERLFERFRLRRMGRMPLLPEKFGCPQEQPRPFLPPHDVRPLVDQDRQIPPGLDPLAVHMSDHRLGRRTDDQRLFEFLAARVRHDGAFGSEPLDVLRLLFEEGVRDQEREVGVDVSRLLEGVVEVPLDRLPDGVPGRTDDHASADGSVIRKFRCLDDIEVPFGEIRASWCDISRHANPSRPRCAGHGRK